MKCLVEFVGQVASKIFALNRHPDVTVLMRKEEIIHFFLVVTYLLNIGHTIHISLLPILYLLKTLQRKIVDWNDAQVLLQKLTIAWPRAVQGTLLPIQPITVPHVWEGSLEHSSLPAKT